MNYIELKKHLFSLSDKKFADFSKTISNSEYKVIGVKTPILRSLIKQGVKDGELRLSDFELGEYLEIDSVFFGLGLLRCKNVDEQFAFLGGHIKKAKSWAITDTVAVYIKKHSFGIYRDFFDNKHKSKYLYERRIAYVLGLKHYRKKEILELLKHINENEEYMVMMAEAWLLATIAIICPDNVYDFLSKTNDITLKKKTISKILDSFRFDEQAKQRFKSLR